MRYHSLIEPLLARLQQDPEETVLEFWGEDGSRESIRAESLHRKILGQAAAFQQAGVGLQGLAMRFEVCTLFFQAIPLRLETFALRYKGKTIIFQVFATNLQGPTFKCKFLPGHRCILPDFAIHLSLHPCQLSTVGRISLAHLSPNLSDKLGKLHIRHLDTMRR